MNIENCCKIAQCCTQTEAWQIKFSNVNSDINFYIKETGKNNSESINLHFINYYSCQLDGRELECTEVERGLGVFVD